VSSKSFYIVRSRYVAKTPPVEARSPGHRSNVENAHVDAQSPASHPHAHFPYTARNFEIAARHPPVTGQQHA